MTTREQLRSAVLGGIPIDSKLLAAWDICDIATQQAKYLIEQARDEGEELDEDTAFQRACEDSDLYQIEWEYLLEHLTALIAERNPDGKWYCNVQNFGWREIDGYKYFTAENGAKFLAAILPDCDCTFKIFDYQAGKGFAIQNWHHDSPVGREWYYVMPDERVSCVVCGDKGGPEEITTCNKCGYDLCLNCHGPGDICYDCEEEVEDREEGRRLILPQSSGTWMR